MRPQTMPDHFATKRVPFAQKVESFRLPDENTLRCSCECRSLSGLRERRAVAGKCDQAACRKGTLRRSH
jgi:hypothetical protein